MGAIVGFLIMAIVTSIAMVANVGLILMAEDKRDLIPPATFSVLLVLLGSATGAVGYKTMNNIDSLRNVKSCECTIESANPVNLQIEETVD